MNLEQSIIKKDNGKYVYSTIDIFVEDFKSFANPDFPKRVIGSQVKGDLNTISFLCDSRKLDFKPYKIYYIEGIKKYFRRDN